MATASLDLTVANQTDNTVSVFNGDGSGGFATATTLDTGGGPRALLAADFNSDEVPDLVSANQEDNNVSVFLSLRNGSFTPPLQLPTGNTPVALAASDVNEDNLPDLIVSNTASNTVTVTLNTSSLPVSSDAAPTAYPASEYVDLGLKVTATPRIHPGDEVTLRMQFEMSALSGSDINGIPIIGNRSVDQVVRLREGQTSILAGMIQSNEFRSFTGANPFSLFSGTLARLDTSDSNTELLIVITPREIRLGPRPGRTLYAGRGEGPTAAPAGPVRRSMRPRARSRPRNNLREPYSPRVRPPNFHRRPWFSRKRFRPTSTRPRPVAKTRICHPQVRLSLPLATVRHSAAWCRRHSEERSDEESLLRALWDAQQRVPRRFYLQLSNMIVVIPKRFTARDLLCGHSSRHYPRGRSSNFAQWDK